MRAPTLSRTRSRATRRSPGSSKSRSSWSVPTATSITDPLPSFRFTGCDKIRSAMRAPSLSRTLSRATGRSPCSSKSRAPCSVPTATSTADPLPPPALQPRHQLDQRCGRRVSRGRAQDQHDARLAFVSRARRALFRPTATSTTDPCLPTAWAPTLRSALRW
jgi:hypothetical protein